MTHEERVYDTDLHFIVDPVTRTVHNKSGKVTIIQYDHNSERITFEVPRYIDSHDMAECNRVEVHYNNIATGKTNRGLYEVTDLQVSPDDSRYVICSWLISQNATRLVGRLAFVVRFSCIRSEGVEEGLYDYSWNTAPYGDISIVAGINNAEELVYEYPDILMQWKNDLVEAGVIETIEQTKTSIEENGVNEITVFMVDGTEYTFNVRNGSKGPRGYSAYEIATQNGYDGTEAEWNAAVNAARVAAETAAENAETTAEEIRQYLEDVTGNTWESSDDLSWNESAMPSHSTWQAITYGNGMFVAIANDSNKTAYSTDGENWTETTNLPSQSSWYSVTYGDGKFVAVAYGTAAAYSTDGITWTAVTLPTSRNWRSIAYGNGMFVAISSSSNVIACSNDGITWGDVTLPDGSGSLWYAVTFGNGLFVAISNNSDLVMCSSDGVNWTLGTLPYSIGWRAITYGNGMFVTVAYKNNIAAYSTDGENWTETALPTTAYWCSVAYGNGIFMAVTYNSTISAYSEDGIHWTELELPYKTYGYYAAYGNGRFVAVGWDSNKAVYSETDEVFASRVDYDEVSEIVKKSLSNAPNIAMIDKTFATMSADQDKGVVVTSDGVMIVNDADDNNQNVLMTSNAFMFSGNGLISGLATPIANTHAVNKEYVDGKSYLKTETWTFTLEDGSTVTKVVYVG